MDNLQDEGLGILLSVNSSRMDFQTLVENGVHPPIAFKTKADLDAWVFDCGNKLEYRALGARDIEGDVAVVEGSVGARYYSQVWVRAAYEGYRSGLKCEIKFAEGSLHVSKTLDSLIREQDADHTVGRTRLMDKWPLAWVNLMLVVSSLNRGVGSLLETEELQISPDQTRYLLDVPCLIKTFLRSEQKLEREKVQSYFDETRKAFINNPRNQGEITMFVEAEGIFEKIAEAHVPPLSFKRRSAMFGPRRIKVGTMSELLQDSLERNDHGSVAGRVTE
ncbi:MULTISPECIES: hypothetical protein [Paraburkholderia]|uniref:hypothetical protein n=1 Tax=Paraburkholderia TaxID=1822464 RepID=UPI0022599EB3|nr:MULTISPECIES: hypothetical protein [Paraburkholderia]MCX4156305.1 hypothetical protein [Paraburkholderia aspalathi]MDN7165710.1 hypothetical protein [Paraburkholderia sp. SECH2]MDQ6394196.1 hypothetical protein [Paraburkholderia aspalathi]